MSLLFPPVRVRISAQPAKQEAGLQVQVQTGWLPNPCLPTVPGCRHGCSTPKLFTIWREASGILRSWQIWSSVTMPKWWWFESLFICWSNSSIINMHRLDDKNHKGENSMWGRDKQKALLKKKAYIKINLHDVSLAWFKKKKMLNWIRPKIRQNTESFITHRPVPFETDY